MQVQLLLSAPTKRGKDFTLPLFVGINLVISTGVDGGGANGDRSAAVYSQYAAQDRAAKGATPAEWLLLLYL